MTTEKDIIEPIEKKFWEDESWRKEQIKKMERNKEARIKRRDKSAISDFEAYLKSGRRTY